MNKAILTAALAFVSATVAVAKTNISVTTNETQLVMQVKDNGRLYQKVYLRYYPPALKRIFAGAAIRAHHFGKADYIEFSIGTVL